MAPYLLLHFFFDSPCILIVCLVKSCNGGGGFGTANSVVIMCSAVLASVQIKKKNLGIHRMPSS